MVTMRMGITKEAWLMAKLKLRSLYFIILAGVILGTAAGLAVFGSAGASQPRQNTEEYCLSCHGNQDLQMTLPSGEVLSLYVSPDKLMASIHSPLGIECKACHTDINSYPHPEDTYQTRRDLSRGYYLSCKKCHSTIYEKAQDSMHAEVAAEHPEAPVCTDCHGSHYVQPAGEPRAQISTTCSTCHEEIYTSYKQSIHGEALIGEHNPDVPVCTDCHGVHNIQDPRTAQFHIDTPEMCANCHANEELMSKYGLPADVYNLYELSWHGVDVSVYKARWPTIWHESAVCTDCHGKHNILPSDNPQSTVNQAHLLETCQKCHPGVGENWTGAWTGHNKISLERTPWLFYVDVFYATFTPVVLWIAGIYVLLQIIRAAVDRVRRSLR
jgi:nitrate/TMAO reductase-like tetraheme cytochrome c subunit